MKKLCIFFVVLSIFICGCESSSVSLNENIIYVNDIIVNKSHAYVDIGDKIILLAQVFPFNSNNQKILWKSDNSNIACVDEGIVIGVSEGRTVITAISEDGNFSASCIVFVSTPKLDYKNTHNNLK
jgi:uncharacterized protein YjdB